MTGPDHRREAERFAEQAETWANAEGGWKSTMTTEERHRRRAGDLAAAQVHATLDLGDALRDVLAVVTGKAAETPADPPKTDAEIARLREVVSKLRAQLRDARGGEPASSLDVLRDAADEVERLPEPAGPAETNRELTERQDRILVAAYRDVEASGKRAPTVGTFGFEEWVTEVLVAAGETHTVRRGLRVPLASMDDTDDTDDRLTTAERRLLGGIGQRLRARLGETSAAPGQDLAALGTLDIQTAADEIGEDQALEGTEAGEGR